MDATLVTAWTQLCQTLESAFTAPTIINFLHVAGGWVLCRSRPTELDKPHEPMKRP
ncbi:MAG: hypothetical protein IT445_19640 [Phycisphaeraceae bacterium]|nr:hypothetical protein [Phycisphaeraceae bacterium]